MKIYFDNQQLEAYHPILHIETLTHKNLQSKCRVNLTLTCDYDEYRRISADTLAANNFFKKITIENGNQLFVLHNSLLTSMNCTNIVGVSVKEFLKLEIELIPETIECQSLVDCFME